MHQVQNTKSECTLMMTSGGGEAHDGPGHVTHVPFMRQLTSSHLMHIVFPVSSAPLVGTQQLRAKKHLAVERRVPLRCYVVDGGRDSGPDRRGKRTPRCESGLPYWWCWFGRFGTSGQAGCPGALSGRRRGTRCVMRVALVVCGAAVEQQAARLCLKNSCKAPLVFGTRVGNGPCPLWEKGACEDTN